jgi:hypothetical protein
VKAIVEHPKYWKTPTTGLAAFLLLEGCRDLTYKKGGGFFTAMLKSEFHVIRHALEAYANAEVIQGTPEACGLMIEEGRSIGLMVRVNGADKYLIDRWD